MARVSYSGQLSVVDGGDRRDWNSVVSDEEITEGVGHVVLLGGSADTVISLGGLGTSAAARAVRIEADQHVKVRFAAGGTSTQGVGWDIPAGGFVVGGLTNVTMMRISNQSSADATVWAEVYGY
jgi:hypothetical protein